MSRNSKRKLAIVAGISECLVYAEAKYCAFEIHGDPKYYVCPRTEYCCNFGCCVSPGFQIYHLWYYWLLVIVMFLVCSGGGWWYRYWLQGRYRAAASTIPSRGAGSSRNQSALRGPTCPAQQASITYNSARNTVLLHRMWKAGPHRSAGSSPAYSGLPVAAAASSTHYQNTSVVLNDVNCPYYQLYGPPPSYETVIAQTRGKISSPMSPERTRNLDVSSATGSSVLPNQDVVPRCYNHSPYNSHPSQAGTIAGIQDSPAITLYEHNANIGEPAHQIDPHLEASATFSPYAPPYTGNTTGVTPVHSATRQETCLSLDYHGGPIPPLDYHADAASIVPDTFRIYHSDNLERLPSYHGERATSLDPKIRKINSSALPGCTKRESHRSSLVLPGDSHSSVPDLKIEDDRGDPYGRKARTPQDDQRERYSRHHGGSLKFSRARDEAHPAAVTYGSFRRGQTFLEIATGGATSRISNSSEEAVGNRATNGNSTSEPMSSRECRIPDDFRDSPTQGPFSRSTRNGLLNGIESCRTSLRRYGIQQQQTTNPSDNVILEPFTSAIKFEAEGAAAGSIDSAAVDVDQSDNPACWRNRRHDEKRRRRVPSPGARAGTTNNDELDDDDSSASLVNNHESKHNKLDRSKSLD